MAPQAKSGVPATPTGVYSLDSAFGTAANPGTGLPYTQVGSNHWWSGDDHSPTFNSMQVCQKAQCQFNTADSENLQIPQYKHAVVMGVNKNKVPGGGAAFFFHTTDGQPTEGCVAVDDAQLVSIMKWLRPGAVIAITK
jgi:L,D-peptidoglycan transpeptidase YkuD (ErfK/YbiS/YcfS/YnhG family)